MGCRRRAGAGAAVGKRPTGRRPVLSECGGGDGRGRLLSRAGLRGEPAPRRRGGGGGVPCVVDGARQRGAQADLAVVEPERAGRDAGGGECVAGGALRLRRATGAVRRRCRDHGLGDGTGQPAAPGVQGVRRTARGVGPAPRHRHPRGGRRRRQRDAAGRDPERRVAHRSVGAAGADAATVEPRVLSGAVHAAARDGECSAAGEDRRGSADRRHSPPAAAARRGRGGGARSARSQWAAAGELPARGHGEGAGGGGGGKEGGGGFWGGTGEANRRFREGGTAAIPGWRTDRGRIFIRYGAPDEVLSRPQAGSTAPYEVWKYTRVRARKFVFYDVTRFGNYVLIWTDERRESSRPNWRDLLGPEAVEDVQRF